MEASRVEMESLGNEIEIDESCFGVKEERLKKFLFKVFYMYKTTALYFFCLLATLQSACSLSLSKTVNELAKNIAAKIQGKKAEDISQNLINHHQITDLLRISGVKSVFAIENNHKVLFIASGRVIVLSFFYSTLQAINTGIKYAKKRNK